MFVHRVLAVFEERLLPVRGRAVLLLLSGGFGNYGVVGFLPRRFLLCLAVWHVNYSTHGVRILSTTEAQSYVCAMLLGRLARYLSLPVGEGAGAGCGVEEVGEGQDISVGLGGWVERRLVLPRCRRVSGLGKSLGQEVDPEGGVPFGTVAFSTVLSSTCRIFRVRRSRLFWSRRWFCLPSLLLWTEMNIWFRDIHPLFSRSGIRCSTSLFLPPPLFPVLLTGFHRSI